MYFNGLFFFSLESIRRRILQKNYHTISSICGWNNANCSRDNAFSKIVIEQVHSWISVIWSQNDINHGSMLPGLGGGGKPNQI